MQEQEQWVVIEHKMHIGSPSWRLVLLAFIVLAALWLLS